MIYDKNNLVNWLCIIIFTKMDINRFVVLSLSFLTIIDFSDRPIPFFFATISVVFCHLNLVSFCPITRDIFGLPIIFCVCLPPIYISSLLIADFFCAILIFAFLVISIAIFLAISISIFIFMLIFIFITFISLFTFIFIFISAVIVISSFSITPDFSCFITPFSFYLLLIFVASLLSLDFFFVILISLVVF